MKCSFLRSTVQPRPISNGEYLCDGNQRLFRADVVHFQENKAGFEPRDIESENAGRLDAEVLALFHENVPDSLRMFAVNPNFVAQITGITGARNDDRNIKNLAASETKKSQCAQIGIDDLLQDFECIRSLKRERGDLLGDFLNRNIHPDRVELEAIAGSDRPD